MARVFLYVPDIPHRSGFLPAVPQLDRELWTGCVSVGLPNLIKEDNQKARLNALAVLGLAFSLMADFIVADGRPDSDALPGALPAGCASRYALTVKSTTAGHPLV